MTTITRQDVIASMEESADRMGLDLEDLQEMIGDVLEDCVTKVKLLKEAISAGNTAQVKSIAHDIKGSTANYGLPSISAIAGLIESQSENPPSGSADELATQLELFIGFGLEK